MNLYKKCRICVFIIFCFSNGIQGVFVGVANKNTYGRFGDQLLNYCKAKYISYQYNIPFFFTLFPYANLLQLSIHEKKLTYRLSNIINPRIGPLVVNFGKELLIWGTLYYKEIDWRHNLGMHGFFEYIIKHSDFRHELRKMISPIENIDYFVPKTERFSVALHIRKGGGYDASLQSQQFYTSHVKTYYEYSICDKKGDMQIIEDHHIRKKYADRDKPRKFPPEQYYIEQVKKVSDYLGDIPLYVYIFTDDKNPEILLNRIRQKVNKANILWDCHKNSHTYTTTFLSDMYSMASFDCLIRPESNFSTISQIIGNHQIIVYPIKEIWQGNQLHMAAVSFMDMRQYIRKK